jgi:polysaccharide chain length determinant protein (PEP-CTERM system associated)
MNSTGDFNVSQLLSGIYRRKQLVIAVFAVASLLAGYLAAVLPDIYRSSTVILVTPQRVPSSFVTSTVTTDLGERMRSIVQEILSRTQLEKIIQEFNLSASELKGETLDDRVESLRRKITIDIQRNNVFQLSFQSRSPEKAKQVTNRLGSLFIEQNLLVREREALGTKSFINTEANRLRKELEEQEIAVNRYKAAHLFELPEQRETNLRSLEQLQREIEAASQRLTALQERKGILQKQSVESDTITIDAKGATVTVSADDTIQGLQIEMKKKELDSLLQRYSNKHPDVLQLRKEIEALETKSKDTVLPNPGNLTKASGGGSLKQVLKTQIADIEAEIQAVQRQIERSRNQIGILQTRVDNTPVRAIELSKVTRGYEITLKKYQDLLAKSLESELSENMEKSKKSEQFQILDPANFPLKPFSPNRSLIILIGLLAGLIGGVGLAVVWDSLNTSFKKSEELDGYVNVPLLATIPASLTRGSVLEARRAQGVLVFASIGVLTVGMICIRLFGPTYF